MVYGEVNPLKGGVEIPQKERVAIYRDDSLSDRSIKQSA